MFMVVSASGDPSNISNLTAFDSIPEWRLVPNDNNIGQRNVFPVAGGGGLKGLLGSLDKQNIRIKNPLLATARMVVDVRLPKFLVDRGWAATFENPDAGVFALKSGEVKVVVLRLKPGKEFTAQDVVKARSNGVIEVLATADGIVVGGMSYPLDPKLTGQSPNRVSGVAKKAAGKKPLAKKPGAKKPGAKKPGAKKPSAKRVIRKTTGAKKR
jgi:hypothetical protein